MLSRVREYYDRRAAEYDDWYLGTGLYAERARPGWAAELAALTTALAALAPARTLDVACGTGFLTRHLPGEVWALDQSPRMVAVARARLPADRVLRGDALALPFADGAFERIAAGHFYGHLEPAERARFLAEAARVGAELLVVDSARRPDVPAERWDPRVLSDGSEHAVFKRWFTPEGCNRS
jgi:SAM-dependent methyltransferase